MGPWGNYENMRIYLEVGNLGTIVWGSLLTIRPVHDLVIFVYKWDGGLWLKNVIFITSADKLGIAGGGTT